MVLLLDWMTPAWIKEEAILKELSSCVAVITEYKKIDKLLNYNIFVFRILQIFFNQEWLIFTSEVLIESLVMSLPGGIIIHSTCAVNQQYSLRTKVITSTLPFPQQILTSRDSTMEPEFQELSCIDLWCTLIK